MTYLANNHVLLVKTDEQTQHDRLIKRELDDEQIQRRLDSQYTFEQKKESVQELIAHDLFGKIWEVDNQEPNASKNISQQFREIVQYFKLA